MNGFGNLSDVAGWAAALLTLLAFSCNNLVHLRLTALAANGAFIAYGLTAQLWPVAALHVVLAPVNLWRLWQVQPLVRSRLTRSPSWPCIGLQNDPAPPSRATRKCT